jgi:hypothetical protein
MRSKVLALGAAAAIAIAALSASSAGAGSRTTAGKKKTVTLTFPIPAASSSAVVQLSEVSIKVKAPKGKKLGRAALRMAKPSGLDSNVRAVAVLESPKKAGRTETFTILASITHFPGAARRHASTPTAAAAQDGYVRVTFEPHWPDPNHKDHYVPTGIKDYSENCKGLALLNTAFEGTKSYVAGQGVYELYTVLPSGAPTYQSSEPEEILDDQVSKMWGPAKCDGTPEAWDSGPG